MRARALLLAGLLIVSLAIAGVSGANTVTDDGDITDLGTDHDLDTADGIQDYHDDGVSTAEATRLDMSVTVADKKGDVGLEDHLTPTDAFNDYLRFEYREDAERTVRILIPEDYWTPYEREEVKSVGGDHVANFEPVRGGDYTAVVIRFDGPADVVFPADWVASFSYTALEYADNRLNHSIGITIRDDNSQWSYVNSSDMASGPGLEITEDITDVTVQYDATPDSVDETWINAPEGETFSDDIYYYQRDSEEGSVYIVSKTDSPPTVRYNVDSSLTDRIRGNINELTNIPNKVRDLLGGDFFG